MKSIHGKKMSVKDLRKRVGNMDQVAGIRLVQLQNGNEHPARAAIIHTGSGLEFTVMLDRGMDISAASFCGKAMGWRATPGDVAPQYYEAEGFRWLRSFSGGLLTTCGFTNVGSPPEKSELTGQGLHGRANNLPAKDIEIVQEWQGNDYVLKITGKMRETSVFGENLVLKRTIETRAGERKFWINDTLTNEAFTKTPFMLLYHCNIGWPAVDNGSEVITPSKFLAPRDEEAIINQEDWFKLDPPTHNYKEKCYYHDMMPARDGTVTAAIVNDGFKNGNGFGVYVKYSKKNLPRFVQWKQMGEQDYVVGLEPCNCGVTGKKDDDEHKLLHTLKPGESKDFKLEFGPITEKAEVDALRASCRRADAHLTQSYLDFVKRP